MLLPIHLPVFYDDFWWYISARNGCLYKKKTKPFLLNPTGKHKGRISTVLESCRNPYNCKPPERPSSVEVDSNSLRHLTNYNNKLFALGNKRFLQSIFYSSRRHSLFDTTTEAFNAIDAVPPHDSQKGEYCLQRSLLAAKTSKQFSRNNGCLLIGSFLETGGMHAWLMEGKVQPDPQDRNWINFQPLLVYLSVG